MMMIISAVLTFALYRSTRSTTRITVSITGTQTDEAKITEIRITEKEDDEAFCHSRGKVYVSGFGERYHVDENCHGLRSRRTSLRALTACRSCFPDGDA